MCMCETVCVQVTIVNLHFISEWERPEMGGIKIYELWARTASFYEGKSMFDVVVPKLNLLSKMLFSCLVRSST